MCRSCHTDCSVAVQQRVAAGGAAPNRRWIMAAQKLFRVIFGKMREGDVGRDVFYFAQREVGYPGILWRRHCVWNRFWGYLDQWAGRTDRVHPRIKPVVSAGHTGRRQDSRIFSFEPRLAFRRALTRLHSAKTDLVLGLYARTISGFGTWSWSIAKAGCANCSSGQIRQKRNWVGSSLCGHQDSLNLCMSISQRRGRRQNSRARSCPAK